MKIYRIAKMDSKSIQYLLSLIAIKYPVGQISDGALRIALGETDDEEIIKDVLEYHSIYFCLTHDVLKNPLSWKHSALYRNRVINLLEQVKNSGTDKMTFYISKIGDLDFKFELMRKYNLIATEDPSKHKIEKMPEIKNKGIEELENLLAKSKNWYRTATEDWYTVDIAIYTEDPTILTAILRRGNNDSVSQFAAQNTDCPPEMLEEILRREKEHDTVAYYAAINPSCPPEMLAEILRRGGNDGVSESAAQNPNCPPEILAEVLRRGKDRIYDVYWYAAENPNCPIEAKIQWMRDNGQIETEDPTKHIIEKMPEIKNKGIEELEALLAKSKKIGKLVEAENWRDQSYTSEEMWEMITDIERSKGFSDIPWNSLQKLAGGLLQTKDRNIIEYIFKVILHFPFTADTMFTYLLKNPISWQYPEEIIRVMDGFADCMDGEDESGLTSSWIKNIGDIDLKLNLMRRYNLIEKEDPSKHKIEEVPESKNKGVEELEALLAQSKNWYRIAQGKRPWEMTQQEFMDYHNTGYISSSAYQKYSTVEGLNWLRKNDYPILYSTKIFGAHNIEFRKSGEKLQYTAHDPDGEIARGPDGLALMMSDEEVIAKGYATEDMTIVAFDGDIAIGWASDEFGTDGVWVVKDYQGTGIGTYLLSELRKQHEPERKIGQMTEAGYAMSKSYHKQSVKEAIEKGLLTPDNPKYKDIIKDYPDLVFNKTASIKMAQQELISNTIEYMKQFKLRKSVGWNSVENLADQLKTTKSREIMEYALENIEFFPANIHLFNHIIMNPLSWQYPDEIKRIIAYFKDLGGQSSYDIKYWAKYIGDIDLKLKLMREFGVIEKEDPLKHKIEEMPELKGKGVEELEALLAKSKNWYKTANRVVMYHHTAPENVFLIQQNGLKINQEWGKTQGAQVDIERIYGARPIFLALDPNKFKGANDVTLEIDVTGLDLVADIPSLYDFGGYYSDKDQGMWWDENGVPFPLIDYVDENGMLFYEDLLNPSSPVVKVCIEFTKTAVCENSIEPQRIKVLGKT